MSKTILQEIATFNAEEQNTGTLKTEIAAYQNDVHDYFNNSKEIIADNLSTYKIVAEAIKNDLKNGTDEIDIKIDSNKLQLAALEDFTIKEISENYESLGVIRREFRRRDVQLDNKIDQLTLKKLDHFTGPISSIITDSQGNFTGYTAANLESARDWMYIISRALKYKGHMLLSLNSALTTITIGDDIYNKVVMPGTLDLAGNLSVFGKIFVQSPSTETESITVNQSIHSTAGEVIATTGLSTTNGDIKTGTGNISTVTGNITSGKGSISTDDGDLISLKGGLKVTTGMFTTAGDIETTNGSLKVTTGMSTTNGNITTGVGSLLITKGNLVTTEGNIRTDRGSISTGDGAIATTRGNISTDQGNITTLDGNIKTTRGNISTVRGDIWTEDGKLWVGGINSTWLTGTTKMLMDSGDLTISGRFKSYGALDVPSITTNAISGTDLTLSGIITANGTGTSNFSGGITTNKALNAASITTSGFASFGGNVTIDGTLTVAKATTFNANVNASGYTMTADKFIGVATSANYADVAEKYLCNEILMPGTVVSLSTNDNYEIELYNENLPLAGVISTAPGVRLNENSDTEGSHWLLVALTGRIPVRVSNDVKKGMFLLPDRKNRGQAYGIYKNEVSSNDMLCLIGIAISNSNNGIVEAKVK